MDEQALRTRSRLLKAKNTFLTYCALAAALFGALCLCWVVYALHSTFHNLQSAYASGHTYVVTAFCALALTYAAGTYYYLFSNFNQVAALCRAADGLAPSSY